MFRVSSWPAREVEKPTAGAAKRFDSVTPGVAAGTVMSLWFIYKGMSARSGRPCPCCETAMDRRHCKYVCPNHGVVYDCSDTFW